MAIQVQEQKREFLYNGMVLGDPQTSMSADDVRDFYSAQYGELTTAEVNDLGVENGVHRYEFVKQVGKKG